MLDVPFVGGISFMNALGWYVFATLAVLVLLYLMRPKPLERNIPSLMFFLREKGFSRKLSFLRVLMSSLLFFIQLLALGVLALSTTMPYTTVYGEQAIESTVIVLDNSASMQASGRLDKAVGYAKSAVHGKTSVILAQNYPVQVLENGDKEEAMKSLSAVAPKDTTSNIGDAMLLASDIIGKKTGKVYVISDFINTEGQDPLVAKRILLSKGISVEFINVGGKASNVGIVGMMLGKSTTKAVVKNYDADQKTVTLSVVSKGGTKQIIRKVLPNSVETYDFSTPQGQSEVRIEEKDDFDVDNHAFISADNIRKIKVLLVTNSEKSYLRTALEASRDIELDVANPPVIPSLDYDIIVIQSVSTGLMLPDFYKDSLMKVRNGSSLIIAYQDGIENLDNRLVPVRVGGELNSTRVSAKTTNEITLDIDFGMSFKIFNATAKEGAVAIASTDLGSDAIVLQNEGLGKIVYYGIIDDFSNFKTTIHYPIFWSKLINFLTETDDINEYNFNTGRIFAGQAGSRQYLDKSGFYSIGSRKISASLLNSLESDVSRENTKMLVEEKAISASGSKEQRDVKLEELLVIAGSVLVLLELVYIKWRGDI